MDCIECREMTEAEKEIETDLAEFSMKPASIGSGIKLTT